MHPCCLPFPPREGSCRVSSVRSTHCTLRAPTTALSFLLCCLDSSRLPLLGIDRRPALALFGRVRVAAHLEPGFARAPLLLGHGVHDGRDVPAATPPCQFVCVTERSSAFHSQAPRCVSRNDGDGGGVETKEGDRQGRHTHDRSGTFSSCTWLAKSSLTQWDRPEAIQPARGALDFF